MHSAYSQTGEVAAAADGEPLAHAACGTALEARWYCPTCGEAVDEAETAAADEFV